MRLLLPFAVALALLLGPATPTNATTTPCSGAEYHQFDFFVGNWTVTDAKGKKIGNDVVSKRMNDCVLIEQWKDAVGPGTGFGLTGYEIGRHMWHQTFMDDGGLVLTLDGTLSKGVMHLHGVDYPLSGPRVHEIAWVRHGTNVEELWKVSTDRGRHWKTVFDGSFHPVR